jgi:hypothetical protein
MSRIVLTGNSAPSTPASGKVAVYVDSTDKRVKQIDSNGVISTLAEDGSKDRNILTNGSFRIQQRVAVASTAIPGVTTTTRGGQVADRWAVTTSVASNLNWQQVDTASATETGLLARYYGSIISSTAGKKVMISQFIISAEMAHTRGQKVRVSVKTNQKVGSAQTYKLGLLQLSASGTVDVSPAFLTGAWSTTTGVDPAWGTNLAAIAPDASPTGEGGTITGSYLNITTTVASWQRSSAVFTVPTNAKNLVVVLFSDATGGTTDNISISEFRLTQGADIIDWVDMPLSVELIRCLRFFCKSFAYATVPVTNAGVTTGCVKWTCGVAGAVAGTWSHHLFDVRMWKVPTVTLFNPAAANAQVRQIGATAGDCTSSSASEITDRGTAFTTTPGASAVIGTILGVHYTAEAEFIL